MSIVTKGSTTITNIHSTNGSIKEGTRDYLHKLIILSLDTTHAQHLETLILMQRNFHQIVTLIVHL